MGWKKVKLGELVENFSVRARDYGGSEGLEFLGVSNDDGIVPSKYAAEDKGEEYKIIEKGCFAYNPYRVNVGSIGYQPNDIKGLISPAYVVFKTKPSSIKDDLLFKFLKSAEGLRQIKLYGRGTVRQALRFEDLCKIELTIPDYHEQDILIRKILEVETEVLNIDSELQTQLAYVKQLRQAYLTEAMQGKLVSNDLPAGEENGQQLLEKIKAEKAQLVKDKKLKKERTLALIKLEDLPAGKAGIPFEIPENWVWCRLGEIVMMSRGKFSVRPRNDPRYFGGEHPFIQIGSLDEYGSVINNSPQTLNELGCKVSKKFPKETIVIAIVGGTIGNLGVLGREMYFTDSIVGVLPFEFYVQKFILNYLKHKQPEIKSQGYQMAGQPNIKLPNLENLFIALPPLSIQNKIVEKLDQLMQHCDALEESIKASQTYNQQLLQQVLKEALEVN